MFHISAFKSFLTILVIVKVVTSQTPCISTPPQALRCGDVRTSVSGYISYKPYEFINDNERCVWTISTSSSFPIFEIDILYMGFPYTNNGSDSGPRLTISGIPINETTYHIVSGTGKFNVTNAETVVLVFSSGENARSLNTTGFITDYRFSLSGSNNQFISLPPLRLQYKSSSYADTSLVIIPPFDNYFPGSIFPLIYLEAMTSSESQICVYRQDVFYFNRNNISHPWNNQTSFCNGVESVSIPGHDDIMMTTSVYQTYGGFQRDQWYLHSRCY